MILYELKGPNKGERARIECTSLAEGAKVGTKETVHGKLQKVLDDSLVVVIGTLESTKPLWGGNT